ncbi:cytochrome-c peroxidase [Heliorestis convoluta]|uniref:Methylamine utilization protein MauG n=1 Tax=Heliorestis convoluta TaxID=356322 RepID=A0A5Q2N2G1_9FIRM|nr:cytochrome c peroxidase [Heliorestis convoluta]QGG46755.1 Cytochrome-c peroxidase [Heliorestis convoluta]
MLKKKKASWIAAACSAVLLAVIASGCGSSASTDSSLAPQAPQDDYIALFHPLGEVPIPEDNPMTPEKVDLGKTLFFDPRLSGNNQISCAFCHNPSLGFGDARPTFIGFEGFQGGRNSPTVINVGYYDAFFWDGRSATLEEQALGPIQAAEEMNQDLDELVIKLKAIPGYVEQFKDVFNEEITADNIAKALAAYQRTVIINDSDFDKYLAGDQNALSEEAKRGMDIFVNKGSCLSCHSGPALSDSNFYNTGVLTDDLGRYEVTKKEEDKGKFRTPGLRGLSYTAPYMHNGSIATLEELVHFYNIGGEVEENRDPRVRPLGLTPEEEQDLVAFLKALDGTAPTETLPELP